MKHTAIVILIVTLALVGCSSAASKPAADATKKAEGVAVGQDTVIGLGQLLLRAGPAEPSSQRHAAHPKRGRRRQSRGRRRAGRSGQRHLAEPGRGCQGRSGRGGSRPQQARRGATPTEVAQAQADIAAAQGTVAQAQATVKQIQEAAVRTRNPGRHCPGAVQRARQPAFTGRAQRNARSIWPGWRSIGAAHLRSCARPGNRRTTGVIGAPAGHVRLRGRQGRLPGRDPGPLVRAARRRGRCRSMRPKRRRKSPVPRCRPPRPP